MKKKILLVTLFFGVLFLVRGNIGAWAAADKMPDSRLAKQETTPVPKPAIDIDELKKQLDGQFEYGISGDSVTIGRYRGSAAAVNIPYGMTSIRDCAFEGCENLTSVTIPDSVTRIGYSAFSNCHPDLEIKRIPNRYIITR